jgi:hypothetical protein
MDQDRDEMRRFVLGCLLRNHRLALGLSVDDFVKKLTEAGFPVTSAEMQQLEMGTDHPQGTEPEFWKKLCLASVISFDELWADMEEEMAKPLEETKRELDEMFAKAKRRMEFQQN